MIPESIKNSISELEEKCKLIHPLVAIRCTAFNHERYIRECLDGFVIQKTDFPFVVIVHDDASTDTTAGIIKEYVDKYPDIFFPLFEQENQYSKKLGIVTQVMYEAIKATGAKYVAICEGDDYWVDPHKLQKQIDFLEANPDYSITFHSAQTVNETQHPDFSFNLEQRDYSSDETFMDWIVPTASIVMKTDALKPSNDLRLLNGDIWFILSALDQGKGYAFKEKWSAYRMQNSGVTINRAVKDGVAHRLRFIPHHEYLRETFPKISKKAFRKKQALTYIQVAGESAKLGKSKSLKYIWRAFRIAPSSTLKSLFNIFSSKLKK